MVVKTSRKTIAEAKKQLIKRRVERRSKPKDQESKYRIASEEENREISRTLAEIDFDIKDLNNALDNHEEDIADLKAIDPELAESMRIFYNNIKDANRKLKLKLKKKIVLDTMHQVREYIRDIKTPKDFFEIIYVRSLNDPMLEEALNSFGIKKDYFLHMARTNPDRMMLENDTITDRIADGRRNAIGNAQNAGDPKYIAQLKKKYNIQEPDEEINKLDLIMRGLQDEDMTGIPAGEAAQKIRENFREAIEESAMLSGTYLYNRIINNAILAEQHKMLLDAKADYKKAVEDKEAAEGSKQTTEESKEGTEAEIKGLETTKGLIEGDIKGLEKIKTATEGEIEEARKERDYIRSTNIKDLDSARERLRSIEDQIRTASERLNIVQKQRAEKFSESNGDVRYEQPKRAFTRTNVQEEPTKASQAPSSVQKGTPSGPESSDLEPKPGWYRLAPGGVYKDSTGKVLQSQGKFVRRYEEKNGGRMVMNGSKMGGKMAEIEFLKLKREGKVLDLEDQQATQRPKEAPKEPETTSEEDEEAWEKDLAELDQGNPDINQD